MENAEKKYSGSDLREFLSFLSERIEQYMAYKNIPLLFNDEDWRKKKEHNLFVEIRGKWLDLSRSGIGVVRSEEDEEILSGLFRKSLKVATKLSESSKSIMREGELRFPLIWLDGRVAIVYPGGCYNYIVWKKMMHLYDPMLEDNLGLLE
jgi:hypothetical protein